MTVAVSSSYVGLPGAFGQKNEVLPTPLTLTDIMRSVTGFIVPQ